jgi:hypothetical protein
LTEADLRQLVQVPSWAISCWDRNGRHLANEASSPALAQLVLQSFVARFVDQLPPTGEEWPYLLLTGRFARSLADEDDLEAGIGTILDTFRPDWTGGQAILKDGSFLNGYVIKDQTTFDKIRPVLDDLLASHKSSPEPAPEPLEAKAFRSLERELARVQKPIVGRFHELLKSLEGTVPETYDQAVATVEAIRRFARLAGRQLLFRGQSITLKCARPQRHKLASIQARTFQGGKQKAVYVGRSIPPLSSTPSS